MLSIGKIRGAFEAAAYYSALQKDVSGDAAAYYSAGEEPPGKWVGSGAGGVGLEAGSEIDDEMFSGLLVEHRVGETKLGSTPSEKRVAGFDFTFSAPKSVSLLAVYGDRDVSGEVRRAHAEACREAFEWLETETCGVRRTSSWLETDDDGNPERKQRWDRLDADGFIGASFEQFSNRNGDPQLHTHHVVVNKSAGPDRVWRALDAQRFYLAAKAAGTVYQAELRTRLTDQLGVEWKAVQNGMAEIEGFSEELLAHYSTRRAEIEMMLEAMKAEGDLLSPRRAAQAATLASRQAKGRVDVGKRWQELEETAPEATREVIAEAVGRSEATPADSGEDVIGVDDSLVLDEAAVRRLAHGHSSWGRHDAIAAMGDLIPDGDSSALLAAAERFLKDGVADGRVVALSTANVSTESPVPLTEQEMVRLQSHASEVAWLKDGRLRWLPGDTRYTTRELLNRETTVLSAVNEDVGTPLAPEPAVERTGGDLSRLVEEQKQLVEALGRSRKRTTAVVGPGGSGKTFVLGRLAEELRRSGIHVSGAATSGAGADQLTGAGIRSSTIAGLRVDAARTETPLFTEGQVVIADEASMISTSDLAWLTEQVRQCDARLVLVGDPAQLPSVGAGGLFHQIVAQGDALTQLEGVNMRQRLDLDREALHLLRSGNIEKAVKIYEAGGRVHFSEDRAEVFVAAVADWSRDVAAHGIEQTRLMSVRRADVSDLNRLARAMWDADGHLHGPTVDAGAGKVFQAGDRIVVNKNRGEARYKGLRNSHTGTIESVDPETGGLTFVRDNDGATVTLDGDYVAGHVDYGYATTVHKAQGRTYEAPGRVVGDLDGIMAAEHSYVAMSRSTQESHLYVPLETVPDHMEAEVLARTENPLRKLAGQLAKSTVEPLAAATGRAIPATDTAALEERRGELTALLSEIPTDPTDELTAVEETRSRIAEQPPSTSRDMKLERLAVEADELAERAKVREVFLTDHAGDFLEYDAITAELEMRAIRDAVQQSAHPVISQSAPTPTFTTPILRI